MLQSLLEVLRKARMDNNLLEFFPQQARGCSSCRQAV
jgi:hypothetical protein